MAEKYDYIIVGSGIAGLYTGLLAEGEGSVLLVTKGSIDDCNTKFAQGGIAAAIGHSDSPELHFKDTIAAGDGLCDPAMVRILVDEAVARITDLVNLGVPFDTVDGEVALTLEAAHSVPRILHAGGDTTGRHIETTLSDRVRASGIQLLENCLATEILVEDGTARGIRTLDLPTDKSCSYEGRFVILATGGAGQLYRTTTNPEVATGDGIALAFEAGAEIIDIEFFQFHPTALHLPGVRPFLISEAVRGEGGVLRNIDGHRFMPDYTAKGDLAPRDIVARSIVYEMEKTGQDEVFIDATHLPPSLVTTRFPQIYRVCLEQGLDITRDLIPVAPAAHYTVGGVSVNSWGETSIVGLFAAGETAGTGVHGANRLASNSLLEVLVFSRRIMERTTGQDQPRAAKRARQRALYRSLSRRQKSPAGVAPSRAALQQLLWDKAGIIRNKQGLTEAADVLAGWQRSLPPPNDRSSYELKNLVLVGRLLAEAALLREESRGAHFRSDFSRRLSKWRRHIVFTSG